MAKFCYSLMIIDLDFFIAGSWLLHHQEHGECDSHLPARVSAEPTRVAAHVLEEQTEQQKAEWVDPIQWLLVQEHIQVNTN